MSARKLFRAGLSADRGILIPVRAAIPQSCARGSFIENAGTTTYFPCMRGPADCVGAGARFECEKMREMLMEALGLLGKRSVQPWMDGSS